MNHVVQFGTEEDVQVLMEKRRHNGTLWQAVFMFSVSLAMLFLIMLIFSVVNTTFGYVVLVNEVESSTLIAQKDSVSSFTRAELEQVAFSRLSAGILRRVEYEKPIADRSDEELIALIEQYIIKPKVRKTWGLWDSLFNKIEIDRYMAENEGSYACLLYTSPSPRDRTRSRMPSSA